MYLAEHKSSTTNTTMMFTYKYYIYIYILFLEKCNMDTKTNRYVLHIVFIFVLFYINCILYFLCVCVYMYI